MQLMPVSFLYAAATLVGLIALTALFQAVRSRTIYDRIVSVNVISTTVITMIAILAFALNSTYFLDVALVYAMCGFVGTVAVVKAIRAGYLGRNVKP
jgi:multicomponent Na+:H+ antiporter subunit F